MAGKAAKAEAEIAARGIARDGGFSRNPARLTNA